MHVTMRSARYGSTAGITRLVAVLVVAVIASACVGPDGALSPTSTVIQPPAARNSLNSYTSQDLSEISMVDEGSGTVFTINVPNGQLRSSDGRMLQLDAEQTLVAANAFLGTVQADFIINQGVQYGGPNCGDTGGCVEPTFLGDADSGGVIVERLDGGPGFQRWERIPAGAFRAQQSAPGSRKAQGAQITLTSGGVCSDLLNWGASQQQDYSAGRSSWVTRAFNNAVWGTAGALVGGLFGGAAAAFMQEGTDHYYRSISVGAWSLYWNSYDCGNRLYTYTVGSGGSGTVICRPETWRISFDKGRTWHYIQVDVCEYAAQ